MIREKNESKRLEGKTNQKIMKNKKVEKIKQIQ